MKQVLVKKLADKLNEISRQRDLSIKDLSNLTGISYTTLKPIFNGTQECGFTKLVQIAEALNIKVDDLIGDLYTINENRPSSSVKYYAVFITAAKISYGLLFEIKSGNSSRLIADFSLRCGEVPNIFVNKIQHAIEQLSEQLGKKINPKEIGVFLSALQYNRANNRNRIQNIGDKLFYKVVMQPDAITDYQTFIGNKDGICISINDGDAITYSLDEGKTIRQFHGYGFPISDVAGNFWLGCEAIKHTIRVKEELEKASILSDKILTLYNDDIELLTIAANDDYKSSYSQASSLVKELFNEKKEAYQIVQTSAQKLMAHIDFLDKKTKRKYPLFLSGELAYLYEPFFPEKRLLKINKQPSEALLQHGLKILSKECK